MTSNTRGGRRDGGAQGVHRPGPAGGLLFRRGQAPRKDTGRPQGRPTAADQGLRRQLQPDLFPLLRPLLRPGIAGPQGEGTRPRSGGGDDDGVVHRLWRVTEPAIIDKAQGLLDNKPLFIADGHHRYETAINYRDFMREHHPGFTGKEPFNFVLMYFANMEDQGMTIFPTHRLVFNLTDFRPAFFPRAVERGVRWRNERVAVDDLRRDGKFARSCGRRAEKGMPWPSMPAAKPSISCRLRDEAGNGPLFPGKGPQGAADPGCLHSPPADPRESLGITLEAQEQQLNLKYVKNFDEPFELVHCGEFPLAFLMNPTRMCEVRDVANAGEKMPQKSTYFYPKLLSGLVINRIVEGELAE